MSKVAEKIGPDFKVADISLADWGCKEMRIAETEMPGLMVTREKHGQENPYKEPILSVCI